MNEQVDINPDEPYINPDTRRALRDRLLKEGGMTGMEDAVYTAADDVADAIRASFTVEVPRDPDRAETNLVEVMDKNLAELTRAAENVAYALDHIQEILGRIAHIIDMK